jgi:hypothetical protein
MKDKIKIFKGNKHTNCWIITTAIGGDYLDKWKKTVYRFWVEYANAHGLGIAVVTENLNNQFQPILNGAWQKLLAPEALRKELGVEFRCVLLDTDVFINIGAPNIFDYTEIGKFGVVSKEINLPYDARKIQNRVGYLRKLLKDSTFPLSSILNARPKDLFKMAGFERYFDDYFCAGLLVLDSQVHAELLVKWYESFPNNKEYENLNDWEQTWLNYCIQSREDVQWLDYSWQALWMYEVALFYPFLYDEKTDPKVISACLASSILRNNFLHLAGRWESQIVNNIVPSLNGIDFAQLSLKLGEFENTYIEPVNRGMINP